MYNREDVQGNSNSNATGYLLAALTGALIGAGVALLFAPKTGKKMREDLAKQYEGVSTKVSSFATDAMNRASDVAGRVSDRASDLVGRATDGAKDLADQASNAAHDAVDQGRNKVNHVMNQAQSSANKARL